MVEKNSLLTAVLTLTTTSETLELLSYKSFFSIFLKTMFPLPDMNLYTSTVNIATSLVKHRKIIFFKLLLIMGEAFHFAWLVESRY